MAHTYNPLENAICLYKHKLSDPICSRCDGKRTYCVDYVTRPMVSKVYRLIKKRKFDLIRRANDGDGWEYDTIHQHD